MARGDLSDHEWQQLEPLLPPQTTHQQGKLPPQTTHQQGNPYKDHRTVVNGILWVLRTGAPWRDIPSRYGPWSTCSTRFYRWTQQGIWQKALQSLQAQAEQKGDLDWDVTALDGSYVKAHPHASGAKDAAGAKMASTKKGGLSQRKASPKNNAPKNNAPKSKSRSKQSRASTSKPSDAAGAD